MARKLALLIGVTEYEVDFAPLPAPEADVLALAKVLADPQIGGFEVWEPMLNPRLLDVREAIHDLYANAARDDTVLLFYAGHGEVDFQGRLHFILPETTREKLAARSLDAGYVRDRMGDSRSTRQVAVLDCCYAGRFGDPTRGGEAALEQETFGSGTYVLAAAARAQAAAEPAQDIAGVLRSSVFTSALVEGLRTGVGREDIEHVTVSALFDFTNRQVRALGQQTPTLILDRQNDLTLARNPLFLTSLPQELQESLDLLGRANSRPMRMGGLAELRTDLIDQPLPDLSAWMVRRVVELLEAYRSDDSIRFQQGVVRLLEDLASWSGKPVRWDDPPASPAPWPDLKVFRDVDEPWCPEMVVIPAGEFLMGSPEDEPERYSWEGPQVRVQLAKFALGVYAVTFEEYDAFCRETDRKLPNDRSWGRGRQPAINVSWLDAEAYCKWLSGKTEGEYRLPSEAEWEYACRAGTVTPFWWGETISPEQANYDGTNAYNGGEKGEYRLQTLPVDAFAANPWKLHQTHGNVLEWCADDWAGSHKGAAVDGTPRVLASNRGGKGKVVRGGSWINGPRFCRSACRGYFEPVSLNVSIGFRVARTLTS